EQPVTLVVVVRLVTPSPKPVLVDELAWMESLALWEAENACVLQSWADGVCGTVQLEVLVDGTWASVQGLPEKAPVPLLRKLTVPCGQDLVLASASEPSTVHVLFSYTTLFRSEQPVTLVVVVRLVTPSPKPVLVDELAWMESLAL